MRVLAVCLGVLSLFVAGITATVIDNLDAGGGYEVLDVHPPETADERAAADVGLSYAQALSRHDEATACRLAVERADSRCADGHRCGDRPHVFHAKEEGDWIDVRLDSSCSLRVAERDGRWRVIEDVELIGYA
jgi:hypothetical protein